MKNVSKIQSGFTLIELLIVVAIIAILSSMVGSLIPAFIAARVWPVKALRYE